MRPITPQQRAQLEHVKLPPGVVDLEYFPDLLIVGPQRTGTTWLHAMLGQHPEVFMSNPKEIYSSNKLKKQDSPRFVSDDLNWYLSFFRQGPVEIIRRQIATLLRHRRLYTPKVRGEATAGYAALAPM